jgi:hypothetical protein
LKTEVRSATFKFIDIHSEIFDLRLFVVESKRNRCFHILRLEFFARSVRRIEFQDRIVESVYLKSIEKLSRKFNVEWIDLDKKKRKVF